MIDQIAWKMRDIKAKGIAAMTAAINDEHGDEEK